MFFQGVPGSNPGISRPFIVGLVMLLLFLSMQVCSRLQLFCDFCTQRAASCCLDACHNSACIETSLPSFTEWHTERL